MFLPRPQARPTNWRGAGAAVARPDGTRAIGGSWIEVDGTPYPCSRLRVRRRSARARATYVAVRVTLGPKEAGGEAACRPLPRRGSSFGQPGTWGGRVRREPAAGRRPTQEWPWHARATSIPRIPTCCRWTRERWRSGRARARGAPEWISQRPGAMRFDGHRPASQRQGHPSPPPGRARRSTGAVRPPIPASGSTRPSTRSPTAVRHASGENSRDRVPDHRARRYQGTHLSGC
jgi:hypothetical protein